MASLQEFDHSNSAWNQAVDATEHGDPFCCRTEWQLSFHEVFAPARETVVHASDDSLISFAIHRHGKQQLIEPLEASWLFGCPLLGPNAMTLLAQLLAAEPRATVLLSGMDVNDERTRQLIGSFGTRYEFLHANSETACQASLHGGLDGYLSRRSAKLRRGVRSAARKAQNRGVHFERQQPCDAAEADAVYARMLAVEDQSWKGIGNCGMSEPTSLQFYQRMLHRIATSGAARIVFARHQDRDIGFIFGGLCGPEAKDNIYRGQQFSFADDWRSASIGNLLQLEQLRWLCEEGVARYDMGPVMDYKHHWTEVQVPLDAIAMRPI